MYLIKWVESGKEKSIVADSWVCKDILIKQYEEKGYKPVFELI